MQAPDVLSDCRIGTGSNGGSGHLFGGSKRLGDFSRGVQGAALIDDFHDAVFPAGDGDGAIDVGFSAHGLAFHLKFGGRIFGDLIAAVEFAGIFL